MHIFNLNVGFKALRRSSAGNIHVLSFLLLYTASAISKTIRISLIKCRIKIIIKIHAHHQNVECVHAIIYRQLDLHYKSSAEYLACDFSSIHATRKKNKECCINLHF